MRNPLKALAGYGGPRVSRLRGVLQCIGLCLALVVAAPVLAVEQKSASAGEVRAIAFKANGAVLAGTQGGGLFASNDTGSNWSRIAGFPAKYVWNIAAAGDGTLYIATTEGLYKSADGSVGAAWTRLTRDDTRAVAVAGSGSSALVLAGVQGVGVLRSTDGGANFTDFSSGLDSLDVRSIVIYGADAYLAAYDLFFADPQQGWAPTHLNVGGVFKAATVATASAWTNINTQGSGTLDSKYIVAVVVDGAGTLYAASRDPEGAGSGKVHRLAAGSWTNPTTMETGLLYDVESLAVDRVVSTHVWAGSRALGPYKWNGSQWTRQMVIATDPDLLTSITAIATNTTGGVIVGTRGVGAMYSTTGTSPWGLGFGLTADRVLALTSHESAAPGTWYMGLRNGGIMRSTDSGTTWTAFNNGFSPIEVAPTITTIDAIAANPSNTGEIYAIFESGGYRIYKWSGSMWTPSTDSNTPAPIHPQHLFYPTSTSLLFTDLGFNMGVFRRDAANAWSLRKSGEIGGAGIGKIRKMANPTTLVASTYDFLPYVSTDSGVNWTQVASSSVTQTGFMRLGFYSVADNPNGGSTLAITNKGIYRAASPTSTSWTRVAATGLATNVLSGLAYTSTGKAWATSRDGALYCSNDNGSNWQAVTQPYPAIIVDLTARGNELLMLTDGAGVLRHDGTNCP